MALDPCIAPKGTSTRGDSYQTGTLSEIEGSMAQGGRRSVDSRADPVSRNALSGPAPSLDESGVFLRMESRLDGRHFGLDRHCVLGVLLVDGLVLSPHYHEHLARIIHPRLGADYSRAIRA